MSEELCICGHKVYRHHNGYSYCTGCECANFETTRAEAERPKVELPPIPEADHCEYCGVEDTDHTHANGHGCCGVCCQDHGMLTHPQYKHGEYGFVEKIVSNKNRIMDKLLAALTEIAELKARLQK